MTQEQIAVYEQLVKLVPGLSQGMDLYEANAAILKEINHLRQEIEARDTAIEILGNSLLSQ